MEKLPRVNGIVREIFDGIDNACLDRVHFSNIGQYTFDCEIVYYVKDADYNLYMDVQQALNPGLVKKLDEAGIGLPFPTQTLQIQGPIEELLDTTQHPEAPDPDTASNDTPPPKIH